MNVISTDLKRAFLSSKEDDVNTLYHSLSTHISASPDKAQWTGGLTLRINNTSIHLHTVNSGQDVGYVLFKNKLELLVKQITIFLEEFEKYRYVKPKKLPELKEHRYWLNGTAHGEIPFTGYVAWNIGSKNDTLEGVEPMFTIADCQRSIRWWLYLGKGEWTKKTNQICIDQLIAIKDFIILQTIPAIDRVAAKTNEYLKEGK